MKIGRAVLLSCLPWMVSASPAGGASAEGAHGAAPMERQREAARTLVHPGTVDAPPGVDDQVWALAIPDAAAFRPELVALGERLYFETALSSDGTVACATCHDVTRGFTDQRNVSEGVGDQLGRRNSPTTMNAVLLQSQFWDGRAANLVEQAKQPILNSIEMGQPDEATVVAAVRKAGYEPDFRQVFGRDVTYEDLATAIAAFETTLVFLDAPFDAWLSGKADAIDASAERGFDEWIGWQPAHRALPM
jgi:cytochrome c peroxidase